MVFLFLEVFIVAIFFEHLQEVRFHRVYTYYFKIKCFLFALFDMSHLCFTFKQDIYSTECKKYTVNPVNKPWAYIRTKDKSDGSIFRGGLIIREEKHFNLQSVKHIIFLSFFQIL